LLCVCVFFLLVYCVYVCLSVCVIGFEFNDLRTGNRNRIEDACPDDSWWLILSGNADAEVVCVECYMYLQVEKDRQTRTQRDKEIDVERHTDRESLRENFPWRFRECFGVTLSDGDQLLAFVMLFFSLLVFTPGDWGMWKWTSSARLWSKATNCGT
jgi:hypothetical protein